MKLSSMSGNTDRNILLGYDAVWSGSLTKVLRERHRHHQDSRLARNFVTSVPDCMVSHLRRLLFRLLSTNSPRVQEPF